MKYYTKFLVNTQIEEFINKLNFKKIQFSSEIEPENQSNNQANKNTNQKEVLQEKLTNAIRDKNLNINLSFEVDDKGRNIVKFVDNATKEVIRQMPSEQALKIAESIDNFLEKYGRSFNTGLLVNDKA